MLAALYPCKMAHVVIIITFGANFVTISIPHPLARAALPADAYPSECRGSSERARL